MTFAIFGLLFVATLYAGIRIGSAVEAKRKARSRAQRIHPTGPQFSLN